MRTVKLTHTATMQLLKTKTMSSKVQHEMLL